MDYLEADSLKRDNRLLGRDDPPPVVIINSDGASPLLLIGDHAGRLIPKSLNGLGVEPAAMNLHIAWDIGIAGTGEKLARSLDACFIRQTYSRLVVDCNRAPGTADAMPKASDGVAIPGNASLTDGDIAARQAEIYQPYQDAIAAELDRRRQMGQRCTLVALHSFTPVMDGFERPWRLGVLHRGDSALSDRMVVLLQRELGEAAGDNQPYSMDGTDNTIPLHVDTRGIDYLELEIRQDLIADDDGQAWAAALIARLLLEATA